MKKSYLVFGIVLVAFVAGGLFFLSKNKPATTDTGGTNSQQSQDSTIFGNKMSTARKAYEVALAEAKKFSSDCFLANLSTVNVQPDGTSRTWFIIFYSPAKGTNYKVNVVEGKVELTDDSNKKKTTPVPENWIDSDEVAKIAIPKCGEVIENEFFFDLDTKWTVKCLVGENKTLYVDLNPQTGDFIKTRKAGIGW